MIIDPNRKKPGTVRKEEVVHSTVAFEAHDERICACVFSRGSLESDALALTAVQSLFD